MVYSPAFFDLQLTFARRVAAKFDLSLAHTLSDLTTPPLRKSWDGKDGQSIWQA
jgi:hypothetical protein